MQQYQEKVTQENVYSKQRIKEDYYLTKTKIPLFTKPNDPSLTANGGKDMIILIVNMVDMNMIIRLIINMMA